MSRYFFHIHHDTDHLDEVGTEVASGDLVLPLAVKTAATMMAEDYSLWNGRGLAIRVMGENGDHVLTVELTTIVTRSAQ
jgi:hypothetical protein